MPVVTKDLIPSLSRQGLHTVDSMFVSVKKIYTVVLICTQGCDNEKPFD